MRNFICFFTIVEFLMAENYTNWSYGPAYPPGPQYQSSYEPAYQPAYSSSHNEPSEKTWTIRILKNPIRVSKPKLLPPEGESVFEVEKEIEKIKKSACYPEPERIEFLGDFDRVQVEITHNEAMCSIGLLELRSVLGFKPNGLWETDRKRITNDDKIADARTIREYYELVEPTSPILSTLEQVMKMVEYIDERWPAIRKIYRKYYEEKLAEFKGGNIIDRITVDYMIEQYKKVHSSCSSLSKPFYYKEC
ncbi:hypothetical protein CAEBREN_17942 [Caenorhabditis brenneri]|uniref:Uncharacterized protein n=1 Tax=Caenorhabditis brenneri TaxID=135651 RepID=G0N6L8_CAEBE|nr:hypothetical protein CAEBREN_17942 [Caenorhabditis brenneri]